MGESPWKFESSWPHQVSDGKPPSVSVIDCGPVPKNTRANTVEKYRYSVKSYHSTTVERPAISIDRRDVGTRKAGEATGAFW